MNNRIYHVTIDILNLFMGYLVLYAIMDLALTLLNADTYTYLFAFIPLSGALLSFFLRWQLKHIWSYLLLHLLLLAVLTLISPTLYERILCALYLFGVMLHGLVKRLREEELHRKNASPALLLVFGLISLINLQLKLPQINSFLFILTVLFILLFLLNSYIINFDHYFSMLRESSNVPMKQIKATNHTIIFFFLAMAFMCMIFFTGLPLKELFSGVGQGLLTALRWLLSLLPKSSGNTVPAPQETPPEAPMTNAFELPPANTPSPFWIYLQNILMNLLTIVIIVALLALVSYALYKIYQAFYKEKRNLFKDSTEFISPFDKKEKYRQQSGDTKKKSIFQFFSQSNSDRIRKAFYKAVLSKGDTIPNAFATPLELSEYVLKGAPNDDRILNERAEALASYYEKARYDEEDCSKEEVVEFKKLLQKEKRGQ